MEWNERRAWKRIKGGTCGVIGGEETMRKGAAIILIGTVFLVSGAWADDLRLVPRSVQEFMIAPGESVGIGFQVEGDAVPESLEYRVMDYYGDERYRSTVSVSEEGIEVTLDRPAGYHELYFPRAGQTFGIGAMAPFSGERDEFFGIDAALSWMVEDDRREGLIANLARGGIGIARERVDWRAVNPRPGNFNWHARQTRFHPYPGGYDRVRSTYDSYDIDVLDVFYQSPQWIRERTDHYAFPENLAATSDAWERIGDRWRDYLGGLEAWNRPDAQFGGYLPADQYVPMVRAIRHGWDRGGMDVPMGGGGFSRFNRPYLDLAARNHLLDEVDYLSFHYYGDPLWMEEWVAGFREWLDDHGRRDLPLWITESGSLWHYPESRPPFRLQRETVLKQVMNAVEAKAAGVERYFAFIYPAYDGGRERNAGMTDEHGVPLRSMMGYLQTVSALSHSRYVGDLELGVDELRRVRAFQGSGDQTILVLYTGRVARRHSVELPFSTNRVAGIDGRDLSGADSRSVTVVDGLIFVWASSDAVEPYLERQTRSAELHAANGTGNRPPATPVILQPRLDVDRSVSANQVGYTLRADAATLTIPVRVHNLDNRMVRLDLHVRESYDGETNATLGRDRVNVAANSYRDVEFEIAAALLRPRMGVASVEVLAAGERVERIAPLALNLVVPWQLSDYGEAFRSRQAVSLRDLEPRTQLTSRPSVEGTTMLLTRDGNWRITGNFAEAGNSALDLEFWVPSSIRWEDVDAVLIRARFDRPTMARLRIRTGFGTSHHAANPMIRRDGDWGLYLFPLNTDNFYTDEDLNPRQVARMKRGLTPVERLALEFTHLDERVSENVLEISDVVFLGGSREE